MSRGSSYPLSSLRSENYPGQRAGQRKSFPDHPGYDVSHEPLKQNSGGNKRCERRSAASWYCCLCSCFCFLQRQWLRTEMSLEALSDAIRTALESAKVGSRSSTDRGL